MHTAKHTIFTSCYSTNIAKFPDKTVMLGVSNSVPAELKNRVIHLKSLAPDWEDVKALKYGKIGQNEFTNNYIKKLQRIDRVAPEVFERLKQDDGNMIVVLLCHCKKNTFCHRHVLAKFINEQYHMEIKEL